MRFCVLFWFFSSKIQQLLLLEEGVFIGIINPGKFWNCCWFARKKRGRRAPKWATVTGSQCKMSTLPFHPHEIDCITFRNVSPRINTDALFQDRRWWARSPDSIRAPVLSCWTQDQKKPARGQVCTLSGTPDSLSVKLVSLKLSSWLLLFQPVAWAGAAKSPALYRLCVGFIHSFFIFTDAICAWTIRF